MVSTVVEWIALAILIVIFLSILVATFADSLRTTRNGARAEVEIHRAREEVVLGRHRQAVRRDAARTRREIEDELT